jgi:oligosaccharide repeat unit polymerase
MRGRTTVELRRLFSPLTLVAALYVPLLCIFVVASPQLFQREFRSAKHLTAAAVTFYVASLALFALGAAAGRRRELRRPLRTAFERAAEDHAYTTRRLAPFIRGLFVLAITAYLGWFAIGSARAGSPIELVRIWLSNPFYVKTVLLRTIPGLTTLTQVAVAALPLALAFGLLGRRSALRPLAFTLVTLAAARTLIFSERLAVLELVVPIAYLLLENRKVEAPKAVLWGLGLALAVIVIFGATELRRTYVYTHDFSTTHVAARFFGYYVTSINNGSVVIDRYPAATPIANTGQMLWQFPGITSVRADDAPLVGTFALGYSDLFHRDPPTFWRHVFAAEGLSAEYNVFSTPGYLAADFGWLALPVLFLLGLYSGTLYTRAKSSAFHRALYAVWLIGLLEFMRIMYFFDTRLLPAYLVFGAVYVSIARRARMGAVRSLPPPDAVAVIER